MRRTCLLFICFLFGCPGETVNLLSQPDASNPGADQGGDSGAQTSADANLPDMGSGSDAGPITTDAEMPDLGEADTGAPVADLSLGEGLTCGLTEDERVRAAVRHVACSPNTRATVPGLIEAFDAGLMGNFSGAVDNWLSFDVRQGCSYWQCVARATSCGQVTDECSPASSNIACDPDDRGDVTCDGSRISYCSFEGSRIIADCADFGAQCSSGACEKNGCRFGFNTGGDAGLFCSEDGERLQACAGTFEMECDAWLPGSSCSSFAIQGELPTRWCSPTGQPSGGAYAREDFACGHGSLLMNTETRGAIQFDCFSDGFNGCNERGCASL